MNTASQPVRTPLTLSVTTKTGSTHIYGSRYDVRICKVKYDIVYARTEADLEELEAEARAWGIVGVKFKVA